MSEMAFSDEEETGWTATEWSVRCARGRFTMRSRAQAREWASAHKGDGCGPHKIERRDLEVIELRGPWEPSR